MLCVTGVYFKDITNTVVFNFALECESSECLLFLLRRIFVRKNDFVGPSHSVHSVPVSSKSRPMRIIVLFRLVIL